MNKTIDLRHVRNALMCAIVRFQDNYGRSS